jgi:hypothetical protein
LNNPLGGKINNKNISKKESNPMLEESLPLPKSFKNNIIERMCKSPTLNY